jgi:peptidylprolyl isomerase
MAATPPVVTPSPVSDLNQISLTGVDDTTDKPKVTVPTPFSVTTTQKRILTEGTGPAAKAGQRVTIQYVGLNGTDGKEFDASYGDRPTSFVLDKANNLKGLVDALIGTPVGSRLVLAIPPADAYGIKGRPRAGIGPTDTIVIVVDLKAAKDVLAKATGTAVPPKAGLPTVTVDANGKPKVVLPKAAPPVNLVVQPLVVGAGPKVTKGQQITVQYTGVIWPGGTVFDSSWQNGAASSFQIGVGAVISGWDDGLVGQSVGSRMLLVVPPDSGYGAEGKASANIKGTDTLVFVVDILDAA